MSKRICSVVLICICVVLSMNTACTKEQTSMKKIKNLDYTVLGNEEIPQELIQIIDEKKERALKLTYSDGEYLYIVVGYGEQTTGGYSIRVNDAYQTSNAIYVDTTLIGPKKGEKLMQAVSYPYIVLKTEYIDLRVVFD